MVITKKVYVHPGIKESMPMRQSSAGKRMNGFSPTRFGIVATGHRTGTIQLSPLKITATATNSMRTSENYRNQFNKPSRRVHFALPKSEGDRSSFTSSCDSLNMKCCSSSGSTAFIVQRPATRRRSSTTATATIPTTRFNAAATPTYSNARRDSISTFGSGNGSVWTSSSIRSVPVNVPVTASPGVRSRVHPTGRYARGTLSPTANATAPSAPASTPGGRLLLKAAADGDDDHLREILRRACIVGIPDTDLNAIDRSGRTVLSHLASNGTVDILERILLLPGLDPNRPDNEGNTPLHFAAQAGQVDCLNCMLTRCKGVEIDARNNMGFTPLMKAALQGRNKCAKMLLFAGANPTLKDNGRGLRADQWARFCGRYVCADVIEKHARQKLLERSTSYGNWGGEPEIATTRTIMGKVMPVPPPPPPVAAHHSGIRSKLKKVFRTSSGPGHSEASSVRLVTQLTTAALCASTPVLPSAPSVPPVVKSLIRPLTVPRLQITLVNAGGSHTDSYCNMAEQKVYHQYKTTPLIQPTRMKKKSK